MIVTASVFTALLKATVMPPISYVAINKRLNILLDQVAQTRVNKIDSSNNVGNWYQK